MSSFEHSCDRGRCGMRKQECQAVSWALSSRGILPAVRIVRTAPTQLSNSIKEQCKRNSQSDSERWGKPGDAARFLTKSALEQIWATQRRKQLEEQVQQIEVPPTLPRRWISSSLAEVSLPGEVKGREIPLPLSLTGGQLQVVPGPVKKERKLSTLARSGQSQ